MRTGTILVLLGLILMFGYFGWSFFGYLALTFLLFLVLAVAAVVVGIWVIKRRMQRKLLELSQAMADQLRHRQPPDTSEARRGAIDVEGRVRTPRDGADDPDQL